VSRSWLAAPCRQLSNPHPLRAHGASCSCNPGDSQVTIDDIALPLERGVPIARAPLVCHITAQRGDLLLSLALKVLAELLVVDKFVSFCVNAFVRPLRVTGFEHQRPGIFPVRPLLLVVDVRGGPEHVGPQSFQGEMVASVTPNGSGGSGGGTRRGGLQLLGGRPAPRHRGMGFGANREFCVPAGLVSVGAAAT